MTTTLITGANKSLGFETARRLAEAGHTIYLGSRDEQRGKEAAGRIGARPVQIDVTSDDSVQAAAALIRDEAGHLDVLVNNAGISGGLGRSPGDVTAADMRAVYETNVFGVVRVTHAFLPLLRRSDDPAVINVSSGMGSQTLTHDPDRVESTIAAPLYTASKAAVTMLTMQYAKAMPDVRFNAADPGYTATDFNGHRGTQTVTEGTDAIVTLATEPPAAGTGRYIDRFGPVPW